MNTLIKTAVNKSAPVRVPSDSPLVVALQYLMSVLLVLALAGLGVWLQHTLGSHSQGLSAPELTSQGAAAQLKVDDDDGYQGGLAPFPRTI